MLSGYEHLLLFKRTWVLVSALTCWLTTASNSGPRVSSTLTGFCGHYTHASYRHLCRQNTLTCKKQSLQKGFFFFFFVCLIRLYGIWKGIQHTHTQTEVCFFVCVLRDVWLKLNKGSGDVVHLATCTMSPVLIRAE